VDARPVVIGKAEQRLQVVGDAGQQVARVARRRSARAPAHLLLHRLEDQPGLRRRALDARRRWRPKPPRCPAPSRPHACRGRSPDRPAPSSPPAFSTQGVQYGRDGVAAHGDHTPGKVGVDVGRVAGVQAGVADRHDLARAVSPRPGAGRAAKGWPMMPAATLLLVRGSTRSPIQRTPCTADRAWTCWRTWTGRACGLQAEASRTLSVATTVKPSACASLAMRGRSAASNTSTVSAPARLRRRGSTAGAGARDGRRHAVGVRQVACPAHAGQRLDAVQHGGIGAHHIAEATGRVAQDGACTLERVDPGRLDRADELHQIVVRRVVGRCGPCGRRGCAPARTSVEPKPARWQSPLKRDARRAAGRLQHAGCAAATSSAAAPAPPPSTALRRPSQAQSTPKTTSSRPSSAISGALSTRAAATAIRQGMASCTTPSRASSPRSCAEAENGSASGRVSRADSTAPISTAGSMSPPAAAVAAQVLQQRPVGGGGHRHASATSVPSRWLRRRR
jgi:hypothetical protein